MIGMQATVVHGALIKVGELVAAGSLVQSLTKQLRSKDLRVGIVAVHPSSPFTGGAIMGDRICMDWLATDEGFFIRSLATRDAMGGLVRTCLDTINILVQQVWCYHHWNH